jgi:hypothetical protein
MINKVSLLIVGKPILRVTHIEHFHDGFVFVILVSVRGKFLFH